MGRFRRWGLPLLAKELAELSARRRTYLVRVIYATVLLAVCCFVLFSSIPAAGLTPADYLGHGWPTVMWLSYLQRTGLHLLLPILSCGVFALEKERNTLGLLFLTQLGPWTIVFEKLLSRLLLAMSFLIISAPLAAFAYSLGGVTLDDLSAHGYALLVTSFKIVSICLLCSAYFRTTLSALLASYALIYVLGVITSIAVYIVINGPFAGWQGVLHLFSYFPIYWLFVDRPPLGMTSRPTVPGFGGSLFLRTLVFSAPTVLISTLCVVLSRRYLVSRAFVTPSRRLKKLFERLDRFFEGANNSLGGVVLTRVDRSLPDGNPVAWREVTTRSLGQVRYLFRFLILIETPVILLILFQSSLLNATLELALIGLWIILSLVTCVTAASLIVRERQQQTLDVLLTTPLSGSEFVQEKLAGVNRAIWICQVPMWTCLVFYLSSTRSANDLWFALNQISILLIYPWLIAWIAMSCGLRSKSAVAAVSKTLLSCLLFCVLPFAIGLLFQGVTLVIGIDLISGVLLSLLSEAFTFLSPLRLLFTRGPGSGLITLGGVCPAFVANAFIHGSVLYWLRARCLARADQSLGRLSSMVPASTDDETALRSI